MAEERADVSIPHGAAVEATVNAPPLPDGWVTLYDEDGGTIAVPEAQAAKHLARGYSREYADPEPLFEEMKQLFPAALKAVASYHRGVTKDGHIDPADDAWKAAAEHAVEAAVVCWGRYHRAMQLRYPVRQGEAAEATLEDGRTVRYDPGQVLMVRADGQPQAVPRDEVGLYAGIGWKEVAPAEKAEA